MGVAIITGASSGLGQAYVKAIYQGYPDIDEFWLLARRVDRLKKLADELVDRKVEILPLNLTEPDSFDLFGAFLNARRPMIRLLVNSAGMGRLDDFNEIPWRQQWDMTALNCGAMVSILRLAAPYLQSGGCVLNVCSIAGFAPTPRMSTYGATKAYALSLSGALREEWRQRGVNVLAVCPGPMATEFLEIANITGRSKNFDRLPRSNPDALALGSLRRAMQGRAVYTGKFFYTMYGVLCKLVPHRWLVRWLRF